MPNPGFNVFTRNRLEILVDQLALEIRAPLSTPLEGDLIIVQSQGMARWIAMELARINGICANCHFPFPNAFLSHLCEKLLPDVSEAPLFEISAMAFKIMSILPGYLSKPVYSTLKSYLADDFEGLKLFQLSTKIADLFDQYLVFRPEMILDWERGDKPSDFNQHWQGVMVSWKSSTGRQICGWPSTHPWNPRIAPAYVRCCWRGCPLIIPKPCRCRNGFQPLASHTCPCFIFRS